MVVVPEEGVGVVVTAMRAMAQELQHKIVAFCFLFTFIVHKGEFYF